MAAELKHLIEQIQKEGVDKASQEAEALISQAKEKAAKIVKEAEAKAANLLEQSKIEAESFADRSAKTLEQAARDLLITVGQGCEKVVSEVLGKEVKETLSTDFLEKMLLSLIEQNSGRDLQITVSEADQAALVGFCSEQAKKSGQEIELKSDAEILNGFKVGFKDQSAYLDFSDEALAEALASFLRPALAKTVSQVAQSQQK